MRWLIFIIEKKKKHLDSIIINIFFSVFIYLVLKKEEKMNLNKYNKLIKIFLNYIFCLFEELSDYIILFTSFKDNYTVLILSMDNI